MSTKRRFSWIGRIKAGKNITGTGTKSTPGKFRRPFCSKCGKGGLR